MSILKRSIIQISIVVVVSLSLSTYSSYAEELPSDSSTGEAPTTSINSEEGGIPTTIDPPTEPNPTLEEVSTSSTNPTPNSTPTSQVSIPKATKVNSTPSGTTETELINQEDPIIAGDESKPEKSKMSSIAILSGAIVGLLAGVLIFLKVKNKNQSNPCQKIKKEYDLKKKEMDLTAKNISIQEALLEELKEQIEKKKEKAEEYLIGKGKKQVLQAIGNQTLSNTVETVESAKDLYDQLACKYEKAKDLLEALKQKKKNLNQEVSKLESSYKACISSKTSSEAVKGITGLKLVGITPSTSINITYFVHGTTVDNEAGISSGWSDAELSELGIKQSIDLKEQTKDKKFDVVFCSDLKRAHNSAKLAWEGTYQIIPDARLRECNYGKLNGAPSSIVEPMQEEECIINRFPEGESYEDVKERIADFLEFLKNNYRGKSVAIVAHKAPQLSLDVLIKGKTWGQALVDDWRKTKSWQPGWEYQID